MRSYFVNINNYGNRRKVPITRKLSKFEFANVSTYKKSIPELFTEISKNLEQLKNNDRIKNILDTTKIFKSQKTINKH